MKSINTFSEKKFKSLDFIRQVTKIIKLIEEIEKNWVNPDERIKYLSELKKLLSFMKKKDDTLTELETLFNFFPLGSIEIFDFDKYSTPVMLKFSLKIGESKFVIYKDDFKRNNTKKFPLYLVLDNLRSVFNVGAIFRTAECFGIAKIYCCGYTPLPSSKKIAKSAMGTENLVEWEHFENTLDALKSIRENKIKIYGLELTSQSKNINNFTPNLPAALILGNEALGISESILKKCDEILYIPLYGSKNSLNVSSAATVAINALIKN